MPTDGVIANTTGAWGEPVQTPELYDQSSLIQTSPANATDAALAAAIAAEVARANAAYASSGGAGVTNDVLKAWTSGESYELTAITRDTDEVPTTATVKWPDGSGGTFTTVTKNTTWLAIDAYTITHTLSAKTVTQAAVTRDTGGAVIVKPALTVA